MKKLYVILCITSLLSWRSSASASAPWNMKRILSEGMWVKIEGRHRGRTIYEADEVILKGRASGNFSVEGLLEEIDLLRNFITIAGIRLQIDNQTRAVDPEGAAIPTHRLVHGVRIRAHFTISDDNQRNVQSVQVLNSRDRDVEIKAPIERLLTFGRDRMDIVLLGLRFQCDEKTLFLDPDGRRITADFSKIDAYHRLVDNDDERPAEQFRIGELITIGGEFQVDVIPEKNFDLYDEMDNDILFSKLSTRLEFSSKPHPEVDVFVKVAAREPMGPFDPLHPLRSERKIRLAEANILWRNVLTQHLGLRLGRQDFDESREWLYDENLDGLRLFVNLDPVWMELSVSTNFSEQTELDQGVVNYMLYALYGRGSRRQFAAYIIHREDDDPVINFDRRWYGLRSFGRLGNTIDYWIELALLRGEKGGRRLDGNAIDIGFTHVLKGVFLEPSFTFGYAYGSGDGDFRDNIDGNFRQTGLEDNNDNLNGVNSFKYYGEVFDPELSNMRIFTAGVGFRWARNGSFDIIYHTYGQVIAENKVHGTDFIVEPWGNSKALGDEIDLIWGYEKFRNTDLELIVGLFRADSAFRPFNDTAIRSKLELEFNF